MPARRQSSDILYPFTPAAEAHRALLKGIVDAFFIVHGLPAEVGSGISSYSMSLYSADVQASGNTYVFKAQAPDTFIKTYTFEAPRGVGLAKITANEDDISFIIVDSSNMADLVGTTTNLSVELEPSRVAWHTEEVRTIRLTNEYRDANIATRAGSIANNADSTVLSLSESSNTLRLENGYNCSLSYEEDSQTLTITGVVGGGKGLPTEVPWDSGGGTKDTRTGIKSINGVNDAGNVSIEFGGGITPSYGPHSISLEINED
jgi:hypothetical protein